MTTIEHFETENSENFVHEKADAKLKRIIKILSREARHEKLNYDQLRYIFRAVRVECDIQIPKQQKRLLELPTQDEIRQFYNCIKNPIHRLLFEFLEGTGLRVSELVNLEVARLDFQSNRIFVSQGKGNKDRITLMGNRLKEKILLYLAGRNNRYLFESNRHTKFTTRRIEQLCEDYKAGSAINKDLTPHTFRHYWNTKMAEAGVSEEKRAILAGHSENSDTQKVYTHLSLMGISEEVIAVMDRLK